jgi:hypothetical protein
VKELSEVTCCVVDTGLFLNMARRMAPACKQVLYWNPDCRDYPSVKQATVGDGFEGVARVREFWDIINIIDLFCFPDVQLPELQQYLESIGKAVWGARYGMNLELQRENFLAMLKELGLDVPPHTVVVGVTALRSFLHDKEDYYIKISRFRGDMETHHWRNWAMDRLWLSLLEVKLGPTAEHMHFVCCESIPTDLEIGGDTYCVDGRWPSTMLNGIEGKDKSFFAAVTPRNRMPREVLEVQEVHSWPRHTIASNGRARSASPTTRRTTTTLPRDRACLLSDRSSCSGETSRRLSGPAPMASSSNQTPSASIPSRR